MLIWSELQFLRERKKKWILWFVSQLKKSQYIKVNATEYCQDWTQLIDSTLRVYLSHLIGFVSMYNIILV